MNKETAGTKAPFNPLLVNPLEELEPFTQPLLIERIGIDKSIVTSFEVLDIDTDYINTLPNNKHRYIELIADDNSPIQLKNGKRIGKLTIKDTVIGTLTVNYKKNNLTKSYYINAILSFSISGKTQNNLQNLNTQEYHDRIAEIFQHLQTEYRVAADFEKVKIKQIELNATFFLDEPYESYKQPILMMIRNLPPKKFGKNADSETIKYASWHESNMSRGSDTLETVHAKNNSNSRWLKIYNKGKMLQDIGELGELEQDIMRVEYTIRDKQIIKNAFGSDLVADLTDENINKLFKKYFNKDVTHRFYEWHKRNHNELMELVLKHRSINFKWTGSFFRECRQYAEVNGLPILFDMYDVKSVLKELEPKGSKNAKKRFIRFLKQATYEMDLIGNTKRTEEILKKIVTM